MSTNTDNSGRLTPSICVVAIAMAVLANGLNFLLGNYDHTALGALLSICSLVAIVCVVVSKFTVFSDTEIIPPTYLKHPDFEETMEALRLLAVHDAHYRD